MGVNYNSQLLFGLNISHFTIDYLTCPADNMGMSGKEKGTSPDPPIINNDNRVRVSRNN